MGEWSKTVGEFGEKTVENFLNLIGWGQAPKNIEVDCLKANAHSKGNSDRQTHGIDFFFTYLSPLADLTLKNVHVSSKYTADKYPNSPNRIFKEYIEDLSTAVECFRFSKDKSEHTGSIRGYKHVEDIGVLFWLSNDPEGYDDLASKIITANLAWDGRMETLFLVDNKRISFLFQVIRYVENNYRESQRDFFYPNTGKNLIPSEKKDYGKILPVEYINSSILPMRTQDKSGRTGLILASIDPFTKNDLSRLVGLARDLSKSWSGFVDIIFPDYNELLHSSEVRQVKSDFHRDETIKNLSVHSYSNSFTSINE